MAEKKRRLTPADSPKILDEWKSLHKDYRKIGLSNHQAYLKISEHYGCSPDTARLWLRPDVRKSKNKRQRRSYVPYSKKSDLENRRIHSKISIDIRRHIDIYIKEAYCGQDTPLSLDQIALRISKFSGILLRHNTLMDIVAKHEEKTGQKLLYPTNESPVRYYYNREHPY